jgi:hypothetical protein
MSFDPVVAVGSHNGRLGDQLIKAAHLVAFSCETGIPIIRLLARPYTRAFGRDVSTFDAGACLKRTSSLRQLERLAHWLEIVRSAPSLVEPLGLCAAHLLTLDNGLAWAEAPRSTARHHPVVDLADPAFVSAAASGPLALYGYYFRMPTTAFQRHAETIRAHFAFPERVREPAREWLDRLRRDGRRVIGVHVRLGDFRTSARHRLFYFSPEEYALALGRWLDTEAREDLTFVLCSDERLSGSVFAKRGLRVELTRGDLLEDLCVLSACDLIVGAPSSFSGWAAFLGRCPLALLRRRGSDGQVLPAVEVTDPHDFHARVAEGRPVRNASALLRPALVARRGVSAQVPGST